MALALPPPSRVPFAADPITDAGSSAAWFPFLLPSSRPSTPSFGPCTNQNHGNFPSSRGSAPAWLT
ncbi:hypothetical protein MUK42_29733 [Musa troglodytarum]|uniref:Uncharacterized protein n=1 Tax=Musa troglodytarum TaxID=320322 RepID=A0A9E7JXY1_9LILI|nr:hypothetical protein MUK42_29733 [Musa troglodytarum]